VNPNRYTALGPSAASPSSPGTTTCSSATTRALGRAARCARRWPSRPGPSPRPGSSPCSAGRPGSRRCRTARPGRWSRRDPGRDGLPRCLPGHRDPPGTGRQLGNAVTPAGRGMAHRSSSTPRRRPRGAPSASLRDGASATLSRHHDEQRGQDGGEWWTHARRRVAPYTCRSGRAGPTSGTTARLKGSRARATTAAAADDLRRAHQQDRAAES